MVGRQTHLLVQLLCLSIANHEAARLIIGAIAAGNQLPESLRPGEPRLQVVLHGGSVVQLAAHDGHDAVRNAERFVQLLSVGDHAMEFVPRFTVVRRSENELLHLFELMHAENASSVTVEENKGSHRPGYMSFKDSNTKQYK